jgi:hypothetical protein
MSVYHERQDAEFGTVDGTNAPAPIPDQIVPLLVVVRDAAGDTLALTSEVALPRDRLAYITRLDAICYDLNHDDFVRIGGFILHAEDVHMVRFS